ncbi:MAG: hypothetical protein UT31_C0011G0009 [Parcubacteria group bacterium GW2011_GWF2_39_13b]|nr:MAG: hypothetical protein UT31_C0011G0009 [Parcubacteria group bacterium GW2011_GWF2_39_13b]
MIFSFQETILLLEQYKYIIFFPIAIIEGPIVSIIAGFLVSLKIFNIFISYIIVLAGDAVGDTILYALGRWGGVALIRRVGPYIGVTPARMEKVKEQFDLRGRRAVTLSKLFHGIGMAGLITAGSLKVPFWKYISTCFFVTIFQAAVFLAIGIFFGGAYIKIGQYLDYFAAATFIIALVVILIIVLRKYKLFSRA